MSATPVDRVLEAIRHDLGDPETWGAPVEMRNSLALCALNSAHSLRSHSTSVRNLLRRYRSHRAAAGADPEQDSGPNLIRVIDEAGGPEAFARDILANDGKLPGTRRLPAEGIYEALTNLAELDIATTEQLLAAADDSAAERAWRSVTGLGAQSWAYLLMNAGVTSRTKPDVMVRRFLSRALGEEVTPAYATQLMTAAAESLDVDVRDLDRAIWLHESDADDDSPVGARA